MSTLLSAETNAVVKLDLGNKGGTRRIVFSRLWDSEASHVHYGRLSKFALKHSTLARPNLHRPIITYTDMDGDTITISTHRELKEAFEQFITHPSNTGVTPIVLRVQASFVKRQTDGDNNGMERRMKRMKNNLEANSKVNAETGKKGSGLNEAFIQFIKKQTDGDNNGMEKRMENNLEAYSKVNAETGKRGRKGMKWVKLQLVLDKLVTNMTETIDNLSKDVDGIRTSPRTGNWESRRAVRVPIAKAVVTEEIDKLESTIVTNERLRKGNESKGTPNLANVVSDVNAASPGNGSWEVVS